MSIIKLGSLNFENYELVARPQKIFRSSSLGVTGSVLLMTDGSPSLKDLSRKQFGSISEVASLYDDEEGYNLIDLHKGGLVDDLFKLSHSASQGLRYTKRQEILRTIPGTKLDKNYLKKNTIKNVLYPFYNSQYPTMEWAYTNYNCLNFFEDAAVPSDSVLIYPAGSGSTTETYYAPSEKFTFDFYIKPRTNSDTIKGDSEIPAGTILHMSGCYALSLVSGSSTDVDGVIDNYRLLLQLSSSANIKPDHCKISSTQLTASSDQGDSSYLFLTTDNSIPRDRWTHISVLWPGANNNNGSGSFYLNGNLDSNFTVNKTSIMQSSSPEPGVDDPNAVFVGNYYYGSNSGNQAISLFFNNTATQNDGVTNLVDSETNPEGFAFSNPMRGELHDLKIYNKDISIRRINENSRSGQIEFPFPNDLMFYVPPSFVKETRTRQVLRTPFVADTGKTDDPFNISLSFGIGALDINLENFTREFVRKEYPRLWNLSSSAENTSVFQEGMTGNDIIYRTKSARKKMRTILPCDNGRFIPNFEILSSGSSDTSKFIDSDGRKRLDLIGLNNMFDSNGLGPGLSVHELLRRVPEGQANAGALIPEWRNIGSPRYETGQASFVGDLTGASPEDPSLSPGTVLTIFQRTGDNSSSEVVIFDISNMFYGDMITPGSILLEDMSPSGSNGSLSFRLKDDGQGNIYRANIEEGQPEATWASVGNALYEEGLLVIKSPHLSFFGSKDYRVTFKGERTVYVLEVNIPVERTLHNSSSNPTYQDLVPTDYSNETAEKFTYITGINLHDDNLNVIGKATLSQPFMKREEDKVMIKLRMDF
jgi:hypothetical protein